MTLDHCQKTDPEFAEMLRRGMRQTVLSISLMTTRDRKGGYHGMAVTAVVPFSVDEPSIIVAVSQRASAFPIIRSMGLFCLCQITGDDIDLLEKFGRSDLRASRFVSSDWQSGHEGLPYLKNAATNYFCRVQGTHDYANQTVFVATIEAIQMNDHIESRKCGPLIWFHGGPVKLESQANAS